ncbi:hypothetical protein [Paraburkholderia hospita]|uniref:hypothetical protein n=1 Tax=Paraburkholderia hospita TaxID=169430 RepID=UPI0010559B5B|nr:hypothetical protein [Paraburkholderia hospita]
MQKLYVQFSDSTETTIVAWFAVEQNPEGLANSGNVDSSDARYRAFYDGLPASVQPNLPAAG